MYCYIIGFKRSLKSIDESIFGGQNIGTKYRGLNCTQRPEELIIAENENTRIYHEISICSSQG